MQRVESADGKQFYLPDGGSIEFFDEEGKPLFWLKRRDHPSGRHIMYALTPHDSNRRFGIDPTGQWVSWHSSDKTVALGLDLPLL